MRDRLARRLFPLMASAGLIVAGMLVTTWGSGLAGRTEWALPYDLWGSLIAATRLVHGQLGGIYQQPTGLISLPGTAVILMPVAAVTSALGLTLRIPGPANPHPHVWLVAGPYQIAISCIELFAADALAEHIGVPRWKRALLALGGVGALWSVSARWGHPEDAVAVGLLLYGVLAQSRSRFALAGWLVGAAICVQPLVLLAAPACVAMLPLRRVPWFVVRAALPSAVLLAAAAIANWDATFTAVTSQPNSPTINHPTAWTSLAPHMAGGYVAAWPFRLATIVLACGCALAVRRRWHGLAGEWPPEVITAVLWWVALALALRSFFEPVMVSYYPWPALAIALIPAATGGWTRLLAACFLSAAVTGVGQGSWHDVWAWWVPVVTGMVVLLAVARPWGRLPLELPGRQDRLDLGRRLL